MASNLMICTSALKPLSAKKLNESEATGKKYILEGVFAELDKLNRIREYIQRMNILNILLIFVMTLRRVNLFLVSLTTQMIDLRLSLKKHLTE